MKLTDAAKDLAASQKPVFGRVDGVSLHFNHRVLCDTKKPIQSLLRFKGRQGKEEIGEPMLFGQFLVDYSTVEAVEAALFSRQEREVTARDGARRQESREQHIGAQMHVVMTIDSARRNAVDPTELFKLSSNHVFKGTH